MLTEGHLLSLVVGSCVAYWLCCEPVMMVWTESDRSRPGVHSTGREAKWSNIPLRWALPDESRQEDGLHGTDQNNVSRRVSRILQHIRARAFMLDLLFDEDEQPASTSRFFGPRFPRAPVLEESVRHLDSLFTVSSYLLFSQNQIKSKTFYRPNLWPVSYSRAQILNAVVNISYQGQRSRSNFTKI